MLSLDDKTYSLPLDTRHTYTKLGWEIYMAALLSSTSTDARDLFIKGVYNYVSGGASGTGRHLATGTKLQTLSHWILPPARCRRSPSISKFSKVLRCYPD